MILLDEHFDIAIETPDGIGKLRKLILTLAMQGKLVTQDPKDQPASELLKDIATEKKRLVKEGKIKEQKPLPPIKEEEIPYQLPRGWEWVRIGETAQHNSGKTLDGGRNKGEYREYITTSNLYWGYFILEELRQMPIKEEELEKCTATKGDLLVCEGGEAGRAAVWSYDTDICFQNHIHRVRFYGDIDPYYGFRFFEKINSTGELNKYRKGVAISSISSKTLGSMVLPLPPLGEQKRIVAKIDQLMSLCDKLEAERNERDKKRLSMHAAAMNRLLTAPDKPAFNRSWNFITKHFDELYSVTENVAELKKGILQLAVMGKLVPQDPNDQPASELLKEIEAEKKRLVKEGKIKPQKPLPPIKEEEIPYLLPKGWEWVRLDALGIGQTGTTPPKKATENFGDFIPFIGPGNIKEKKIDYSRNGLSEIGLSRGRLIPKGSIMMVCIGGSIGKAAINTIDVTCNQQINAITPFSTIMTDYLFYVMTAPGFQGDVLKLAGGSATPIVNKQKWSSIPVPLAPLKEQKRIVAKVAALMSLSAELAGNLSSAMEKRTAILDAVLARV